MLRRAARQISAYLFGGRCALCRGAAAPARGETLLCGACTADLPHLAGPLCPRCALGSPGAALCGRCLAQAPAFDATCAALAYRFPADLLVQGLKYRGELAFAGLLGGLLAAQAGRAGDIDAVLPVPLAAARLAERGYNQAMEIARPLARALGAPLEPRLCERVRDTPAQTGLPLAGRARNVRGAFRCAPSLAGASLAVVDDVMTSGSTLDEIAATLKRAGAARVVNFVVARALPPDASDGP